MVVSLCRGVWALLDPSLLFIVCNLHMNVWVWVCLEVLTVCSQWQSWGAQWGMWSCHMLNEELTAGGQWARLRGAGGGEPDGERLTEPCVNLGKGREHICCWCWAQRQRQRHTHHYKVHVWDRHTYNLSTLQQLHQVQPHKLTGSVIHYKMN